MNIMYLYIPFLLISCFSTVFAGDKPLAVSIPDSIRTQVETFEINVNQNSRINLSNKVGVKFILIDSVEARFNHIIENQLKHYWQYVFNLRGGTVHIEYQDVDHLKKNVHIQSSSSDLLVPKRKAIVKINRTGMKLKAEKNNREVAISMEQNFDTSVVLDSLVGSDLVVLSDVPVDPKLLSESLSDEMRVYMPENQKNGKESLLLDSLKEEHCLRIVVLLNRDDKIADTLMNLCRIRIENDSNSIKSAKIESDIFLGTIEDIVKKKSKETLLPDRIFEKRMTLTVESRIPFLLEKIGELILLL